MVVLILQPLKQSIQWVLFHNELSPNHSLNSISPSTPLEFRLYSNLECQQGPNRLQEYLPYHLELCFPLPVGLGILLRAHPHSSWDNFRWWTPMAWWANLVGSQINGWGPLSLQLPFLNSSITLDNLAYAMGQYFLLFASAVARVHLPSRKHLFLSLQIPHKIASSSTHKAITNGWNETPWRW